MILGKIPPAKLPLDGRPPQNFPEWLEVATRNLVPSAKARIRPEIEAHYAEAVQSHLTRGGSDEIAQAAALVDLGDAQAAARRFNQEYLTTSETKMLLQHLKTARGHGVAFYGEIISVLCLAFLSVIYTSVWMFEPRSSNNYLNCAWAMLALALVSAGFSIAARHLAQRENTLTVAREVYLLGMVKQLNTSLRNVVIYMAVILTTSRGNAFKDLLFLHGLLIAACGLGVLRIVLVAIGACQRDARLRKKLAAANEDDLPPPDSSVA